jgi:tRNA1(Val) A37 N6-methylase TrmN6
MKIKFPSVFGQSRQHFTIDHLREIKSILSNPPYHIDIKRKTVTVTFDVSQDINHIEWMKKNKDLISDPTEQYKKEFYGS